SPERRATMMGQSLEWEAQRAGHDPCPRVRPGAPIGHAHPPGHVSPLGEHVEVMPESERDRLEHGSEEIAASRAEVQPDECPSRHCFVNEPATTEKVG